MSRHICNNTAWYFMYTEMFSAEFELTLGRVCGWPRDKVAVIELGAAFAMPDQHPTDACPWLPHRFNVCGFEPITQAVFVDSLDQAIHVKIGMIAAQVKDVRIYDTVDGLFY